MSQALQKKFRIIEGTAICTVNAPANYAEALGPLPKGASITKGITKGHAFIHLFVKNKAELEKEFPKVAKASAPAGLIWISYPKGKKAQDLTRDKGWEAIEKVNMRWLSLISFDADWSAFLLQNVPPLEENRTSDEYHARSNEWADPKTKTVKVPDDLAAAFKKSAKAMKVYEALAYSHRKEYVLWLVSAKREETRKARVQRMIAMLVEGKRNPGEK